MEHKNNIGMREELENIQTLIRKARNKANIIQESNYNPSQETLDSLSDILNDAYYEMNAFMSNHNAKLPVAPSLDIPSPHPEE